MTKSKTNGLGFPVTVELLQRRIYLIRGRKVMLDSDLARRYRVTTGNLNLAVRRNSDRFPDDFMFQLSKEEAESSLTQSARTKDRPVLNTQRAIHPSGSIAQSLENLADHRLTLVTCVDLVQAAVNTPHSFTDMV